VINTVVRIDIEFFYGFNKMIQSAIGKNCLKSSLNNIEYVNKKSGWIEYVFKIIFLEDAILLLIKYKP